MKMLWFRFCCFGLCGLAMGMLVWSCSQGSPTSCKQDADCSAQSYCDPNGMCNADCKSDPDCGNQRTCSSRSRCVSVSGENPSTENPPTEGFAEGIATGDGGEGAQTGGESATDVGLPPEKPFVPGPSPKCETESRECYTGPPGTQGKGLCKAGKQRCVDGLWSPCIGEVLPKTEQCNGIDDDCDGQIDGNCPQWAASMGGIDGDDGLAVAVDSAGNIYTTGIFHGKGTFGTMTHFAKGETDAYIAKFDNKGQFVWVVTVGNTGYDGGKAIAIDKTGHVYAAGYFDKTAIIGSQTLTGAGGKNIYVAKLDDKGQVVWVVTAGGPTGGKDVHGIAVDNDGNTYVTGSFAETSTLGSFTLTAKGLLDVFVAKLNAQGIFQWATQAGGAEVDESMSITVDSSGNSYITGFFQNIALFGETLFTSGAATNAFFSKLDANGKFVWTAQTRQSVFASGTGIAVDASGNVYAGGYFEAGAVFGSKTIESRLNTDVFVTKLDSKGQFAWTTSASTYFSLSGLGMGQDNAGNLYLVGSYAGDVRFGTAAVNARGSTDVYVARINSQGQFTGAISVGGQDGDEGKGIAVDPTGNIYITGLFRNNASFGTISLSAKGYTDAFLTKLTIK